MAGEYSFLEGMTSAATPYLQGAMKEGWRRKSEDKATAEAIKRTQAGQDWQINLARAKGGMGGDFKNPNLQALSNSQKDINEREQAQKQIDEARKVADHKTKQLGLLSKATSGLQGIIDDPNIPNALKLANINSLYSQYKELGYNMPTWTSADLLNAQEKTKSANNTLISTITEKVSKFSKDVSNMPKGTPQKGMMANARANFLLEEIAVLKAGADKTTQSVLTLKENAIKKSLKDFETKNAADEKKRTDFETFKEKEKFKQGLTGDKNTKLTEIMKTYNVDRKTALGVVNKTLKINTNPVTGESVLVDVVSGTSKPIKATVSKQPEITGAKPKQTLYEMADLTAGAVSAVKAGYGAVAGQIGLPIAKKTEFARQRIKTAAQNLIRAMSINSRYPVMEQKRIEKEISIKPSFFDSAQSLRTRMRAIDDFLKKELRENEFVANNTRMEAKERAAATKKISVINNFRRDMGVPQEKTTKIKRFNSIEEFNKGIGSVKTGEQFISPDGKTRTK